MSDTQGTLADIIASKIKEIEKTGYAMWGYSGNTCHPRTMVHPFAEAKKGLPIYLYMHEMDQNRELKGNEL